MKINNKEQTTKNRKSKKLLSARSAFTLIELLISVGIVSILLGVSFAGYASLNQRQTLISAGQTVKSILRDAQSRAISNEVDCSVCSCVPSGSNVFSGWTVDFFAKEIYGQCGASNFSNKQFNLSPDIVITPHITPPTIILFKKYPPGAAQKASLCVSHTNLSSTYYIVRVNETGVVTDDGGLLTTCTP